MPTCPAGHASTATDYCDVCGMPMGADAPAAAEAPTGQACPNCGASNVPDALFCEACGYDFTTGMKPRGAEPVDDLGHQAGSVLTGAPVDPPPAAEPEVVQEADVESAPSVDADADAGADQTHESPPAPSAAPIPPPLPGPLAWVAEVWIDPDWYATQGSSDPLPSPGLPDVVPLRTSTALIGRVSISRNIHPEVDCELDSGVSRRQAQLSTDGTRWWIEDLDSANGTFVAPASGPLPAMPIPRGRVEVSLDQRIYLGAWTRIVIRRATEDEQHAFS